MAAGETASALWLPTPSCASRASRLPSSAGVLAGSPAAAAAAAVDTCGAAHPLALEGRLPSALPPTPSCASSQSSCPADEALLPQLLMLLMLLACTSGSAVWEVSGQVPPPAPLSSRCPSSLPAESAAPTPSCVSSSSSWSGPLAAAGTAASGPQAGWATAPLPAAASLEQVGGTTAAACSSAAESCLGTAAAAAAAVTAASAALRCF